jgi:RNA polymerase sigma-70 factor (ECF subfamily)
MDFDIVWQQYEKELTAFVKARLFDKSLASDIMQEVAIKIYKNKDQLCSIENIRAWLYKVTRNTLIDFYKKNKKTICEKLYEIDLTIANDKNETDDLNSCLIKMMSSSLGESDNKILNLSIIEQYSLKEISSKLGLTIDGTKTKLKRAKKKLSSKFFTCCNLDRDTQGNIVDYKTNNNIKCDC